MIFLDTETVGFHGMAITLQYAKDDSNDIKIWHFWKETIGDSLALLDEIANNDICAFNLAFDWFHLYKIFTVFSLLMETEGPDFIPEDDIEAVSAVEADARDYPLCLRPKSACDLLLHARKGKYQNLMRRKPIVVRRVPTTIVQLVQQELERRIPLDDVYFSQRAKPDSDRWVIKDIKLPNGDINPAFKNISLEFNASMKLKVLVKYALGLSDDFILKFSDIELPKKVRPKEYGYAPFARAVGKPGRWRGAWPEVIHHHINHWYYNKLAQTYAAKDVEYLQLLYDHLDRPEPGDTDSELACMVAVVRWRGFEIDVTNLKKLRDEEKQKIDNIPTAPSAVKRYLSEVMSPTERMALIPGTKEEVLEAIADWDNNKVVAKRAQSIIDARHAAKEIELYDKLIKAGKFHASFKVIGALSSRMSGTDKLNAQGIKAEFKVRKNFILKRPGYCLGQGDFESFEPSIAESVYADPNLRKDILSGKSPHGLFAQEIYPEMSYEEVVATKKTADDKYSDGKTSFFRLMYGGGWEGLAEKLNIKPEVAERAFNNFLKKYPGIENHRKLISDQFCSMTQPGGIGSKVIWKEPADYIDNGLGFKRYFTLENKICKALFELAQEPPKSWTYIKSRVMRKDRQQTSCGAAQSAIYAAAFNIQAKNLRAAANHQIQSKGAVITKELQKRIWSLQPVGVSKWLVQPMQVHDEVLCPTDPSVVDDVANIVSELVDYYRSIVPLLEIGWHKDTKSWAEKE